MGRAFAGLDGLMTANEVAREIELRLAVPVRGAEIASLVHRRLIPAEMARQVGVLWLFAKEDLGEILKIYRDHSKKFKPAKQVSEVAGLRS